MHTSQKLNRQLFVFILVFSAFAYLVAHTVKEPLVAKVFSAPKDEWGVMRSIGAFDDLSWTEAMGDAPAYGEEVNRLLAGVRERGEVAVPVFYVEGAPEVLRGDLYGLLAKITDVDGEFLGEDYFLGSSGEEVPVDALARLGVIELPFDRIFRAEDMVSRDEVVRALARAYEPELRVSNAPVVVQPKIHYTYGLMEADLKRLAAAYPELVTLEVIGQSVEGRHLYAARLGRGEVELFLEASMHAREWLPTPLLMKMLEDYAHHASYGYEFGGYDVAAMLEQVSFWFIPMVNPDGVTLVLEGTGAIESRELVAQIRQRTRSAANFRDWKSNIRGVDLNRNFPTRWSSLVNVNNAPAASHYKGPEPLSEPESRAMVEFTLERMPSMVISYHQRGEVIFWYYRQQGEQLARDRRIVQALGALTGYRWEFYLTNGGKYRDWVITELGIPAVIMEVGQNLHDLSEWNRAWSKNRYVGLVAAELVLQELEKE